MPLADIVSDAIASAAPLAAGRGIRLVPLGAPEDVALERAMASAAVTQHTDGKEIARVIYVPNRLLNIVVR